MSPLWRDQFDVFLAPRRIDLVQSARGFKPVQQPVATELLPAPEEGQTAWEQALAQLESMLSDRNGTTGAAMMITLSNHFVRYATLAPQDEITTPEEVLAYANFCLREIYGARVDHWQISISSWNPAYGAICAAVQGEFMGQIEAIAKRHDIRLKGIEPYFTAVLDRWGKILDRNRSFVALVETGRLCLGVLHDGVWRGVRNQRTLNNVETVLRAALDQEAVLLGSKEPVERVFLLAPEHPPLVLPPDCGWHVVPLVTEDIVLPAHYPALIADNTGEQNPCPA